MTSHRTGLLARSTSVFFHPCLAGGGSPLPAQQPTPFTPHTFGQAQCGARRSAIQRHPSCPPTFSHVRSRRLESQRTDQLSCGKYFLYADPLIPHSTFTGDSHVWPRTRSLSTRSKNSRSAPTTFGGIFDVDNKKNRLLELDSLSSRDGFWDDTQKAQTVLKEAKELKRTTEAWARLNQDAEDLLTLYEMASEAKDEESLIEAAAQAQSIAKQTAELEFIRKLGGEDDAYQAELVIHSGAGGTESCDWCEMLFRMYTRWMEKKGYPYTVLDSVPGDGAGMRSVSIEVAAQYAYGLLKAESGVHRLVRISPFDANARRHTSFASVCAYPLYDDTGDYKLEEKDIRVDTYRASGAGGQHINKTDSAVRMTHIPTNIVVACQNERSQMKNRAVAIKVLTARVRTFLKEKEAAEREGKLADKKKIDFGSQIRSYVLHPYNLVKDHRTDVETSNTKAVLDGEIDEFIEGYLLTLTPK